MMRKSQLRNINWVTASSDPAMSLQMSLADELSRCSLDASLLPIEHRAYTFVNIYNLLFLFSCIMHKAHPSSMSASEQNDFFGCRQHCLSFEMVRPFDGHLQIKYVVILLMLPSGQSRRAAARAVTQQQGNAPLLHPYHRQAGCEFVGLTLAPQTPNRRWHFRRVFSAERMLQMQGASNFFLVATL
jgi:hypothetical protein